MDKDIVTFKAMNYTSKLVPLKKKGQGMILLTMEESNNEMDDITEEEAREIVENMMNHEFKEIFEDINLGAKVDPIRLVKKDPNMKPIRVQPVMLSEPEEKLLEETVAKLKKQGVIEPGRSSWNFRPVFAPKGDDPKGRFTINFAPLNAKLLDYVYNLPRIEEVLDILGKKGKIYSGFDLKDAFHQLPIHIDDRVMLTFTSTSGRWQYTRLPQGMKMSTSHFQEVISRNLD